ncbi:MAG: hypothetical protein ACD_2C00020G0002 [uncultured bacterium (gcode 4)]|uniref:Efflux transporter, RND family, MFP subunit n=1 Tax=uncultured bacterium (gcode 4) TaxID=1234023 RepID=K2GIG8_9BACT|nr:MAG: hypothetical protein ACD_2C00020G0002 [uncultured bacterium (gcode 4)]
MKKIFTILFLSIFALTSCGTPETMEKKFYKTYTAAEWSVISHDTILSTLEWTSTSDLAFKAPWRIKEILKHEWDIVRSGEILATLSNEEARITLNWSNDILKEIDRMWIDISAISNDTGKIKDAVNSLYDERLRLLDDSYSKAKISAQMAVKDLDLAKSDYANISLISDRTLTTSDQKIKQAQNNYEMSKNNLNNSKASLATAKANILKNAVNSLTNAYIIARNARDYTDTILSLTDANKNKNIDYEMYLGAKNLQKKTNAIASFWNFNSKYLATYDLYSQKIADKKDIPKETISEVLASANSTLTALRNHLHDFKDMLDDSMAAASLPDNSLSNMKIQVSTMLADLEQVILSPNWAWVQWSMEAIDSFESDYALKVRQLEDAMNMAAEDLNLAKTWKSITGIDNSKNLSGLQTNISIKEDSLKLAKIWEEEVLKNMNLLKQEKISKINELNAKISEINSKIREAWSKRAEVEMNTNLAANSLESWIIRAPFDGVVIKVTMDAGAVVWWWMPIITYTSTDKKILKLYADNSKLNLKIWDAVKLINEKTHAAFTWSIINLSDTPDLKNKKNYMEIKLDSDKAQVGERFIINLGWKQDKKNIIIPLGAMIIKYWTPWVYVLKWNKAEFRIVKTLESDNGFVSVEWISEWEKLITDGKDNILDGEILQ